MLESDFGVTRRLDRRGIAEHVIAAMPEAAVADQLGFVGVAPGVAGTILLTTKARAQQHAERGLAACARCGKFVSLEKQGMEWHMKSAHGVTVHAKAFEAAESAQRSIVSYHAGSSPSQRPGGGVTSSAAAPATVAMATATPGKLKLSPSDMAEAQADPATAVRLARDTACSGAVWDWLFQ